MRKHTKPKKFQKDIWFYKVRGSYLPATWQGWLTYLPFTIFLLWSGGVIYGFTNSLALFFILLFTVWVAGAVVMSWIASKKS